MTNTIQQRKFSTESGARNFQLFMSRPNTHIKNVDMRKVRNSETDIHYLVTWEAIPFVTKRLKRSVK